MNGQQVTATTQKVIFSFFKSKIVINESVVLQMKFSNNTLALWYILKKIFLTTDR